MNSYNVLQMNQYVPSIYSKEWKKYIQSLHYTEEVEKYTQDIYLKNNSLFTYKEWIKISPIVSEIMKRKKEKRAIVLAHNYMSKDIFHTVSDYTGDSLALAKYASSCSEKCIVQAGVFFMAETTKILSPEKTVLHPDIQAGCSLSESITAHDVINLKKQHPGVPVVTYVNTSAAVKAVSDICCTSSNAEKIVSNLPDKKVILIPDKYLALNVAEVTNKEIITWEHGSCEVHELFSEDDIDSIRLFNPNIKIIAHPECKPEVVRKSDFCGSTSAMIDYAKKNRGEKIILITECSMASNVLEDAAIEENAIKPCHLCPHMQKITLEKILYSLTYSVHSVSLPKNIIQSARKSLKMMLSYS